MPITIISPSGKGQYPLLFRCRAAEPPLPAYMDLNPENGFVTFLYAHRNSEPAPVTLRRRFWWRISERTKRREAVELAEELRPQLERVCAGYSVEWDGRNHTGALDDDARLARAQIRERLSWTLGPEYAGWVASTAEQ